MNKMRLRFNFFMLIVSILSFSLLCASYIPRYKFSLRGTEYIEHSDRLSLLNEGEEKPFILSKKSVDFMCENMLVYSVFNGWKQVL